MHDRHYLSRGDAMLDEEEDCTCDPAEQTGGGHRVDCACFDESSCETETIMPRRNRARPRGLQSTIDSLRAKREAAEW